MAAEREEGSGLTPMYTVTLTDDGLHGRRVSLAIWDDFLDLTPADARGLAGRLMRVADDAESEVPADEH